MSNLKNNKKWQNFLKHYFKNYIDYFRHLSYSSFIELDTNCYNNIPFNIDYCSRMSFYYENKFPNFTKQIQRLLNNHYHKKKRVKFRLEDFCCYSELLYFGTLTFTDNVLNSTSIDSRRQYVRRFLKSNCYKYIANIDYGDLNHREHYHTCFIAKDSSFINNWKYGFVNVKKVKIDNGFNAISEYIIKLQNHTTKDSASSIIYSRGC